MPAHRAPRDCLKYVLTLAAAISLVAAFAHPVHAQAYLPSVKIGTAALISPSAASTFYGSGTTSTNGLGATSRPPEIVELARALENDPDLIHEYVRNHIEMVWLYGLQKGALGALIDKAGTPFDQAMLMVELLREAGYTTSYKAGTITLSASEFLGWSGISKAKAACQLLANGGVPGAVNGSSSATCDYGTADVSSVTLAHLWVAVEIAGTTYLFDPSYKPHDWKAGLDLATVMGLTSGQPLSQATSGMTSGTVSGVPYIRSLNMSALSTKLADYANNLFGYFESDLPAPELEDIIGGGTISPYHAPSGGLRQTSLPYSATASHTWTGNIPDQYRTTLGLKGEIWKYLPSAYDTMFDLTFFVDEIYGRRLVLDTDFKFGELTSEAKYKYPVLTLELDDVAVATPYIGENIPNTDASTRGAPVVLTFDVNHPYAAAADGSASTGGDYMDAGMVKPVMAITPLTIVHGWGQTGPGLLTKWSDERVGDSAHPYPFHAPLCAASGEPCMSLYTHPIGDFTRSKVAASWLAQVSRAAKMHAEIAKSIPQMHHAIGAVSADARLWAVYTNPANSPDFNQTVGDSFDRVDVDMGLSLTSRTADADARRAALHAIAATADALEGSMAAQMSDLPDTASTATRFEWGNAPPGTEDPSGYGARKFLSVSSANATSATALIVGEGVTYNNNDGTTEVFTPPEISNGELQQWRGAVNYALTSYAGAGFSVVASEESFLGPGQRGGIPANVDPTQPYNWYYHQPTKQRGGALVATRYVNGEPVEIAHIVTTLLPLEAQPPVGVLVKGGGGGVEPEQQAKYDPAEAAEILKARFVDRSNLYGVNLANGSVSYTSPAVLKVGNGEFPYSLSASLSWRAAATPPSVFGPATATQPQPGWTSNWMSSLTLSSSGMEAMGASDPRTAAAAIAAFTATQDIFKSSPSTERDVVGVLVNAWWVRQIVANIVTVALGAGTQQFVRVANGEFMAPGAGPQPMLVQTGTRTAYENICPASSKPGYALSRGWDNSGLSFALTNPNSDVQNFGFWESKYYDTVNFCGKLNGFRLNSWVFPQGVTINLVYGINDEDGGIDGLSISGQSDILQEVNNSLGRKITFSYVDGKLTGFTNGLTGADARAVSIDEVTGTLDEHVGPDGATTKFTYLAPVTAPAATQRQAPYKRLKEVYAADNSNAPSVRYLYDGLNRVREVEDAVAIQLGGRDPYAFRIADGTRGSRTDPLGNVFAIEYDTRARPVRFIDELGRLTTAAYDGRGRLLEYVYPEGDKEAFEYDARNNTIKLTKIAKPGSGLADAVIEAAWHASWNKPVWIKDALGNVTDFAYYASGTGQSLMQSATRPDPDGAGPQGRPIYSFTYNAKGQVLTTTDPTDLAVSNSYDAANGNLLSTALDPAGINAVTSFTYDAQGDVLTTTDPRGFASAFIYDAARRKTEERRHNGTTSANLVAAARTTYDLVGRPIRQESGTAFSGTSVTTWLTTKTIAYTPTGKEASITDADGRKVATAYDALDRVLMVTDPVLRKTRFVYDAAGQQLQEIRAWGTALEQAYATRSWTENGKEASVADAKGNKTAYSYDGFDRLVRAEFPSTTTPGETNANDYEAYEWNANGFLTARRTRRGDWLLYFFDDLNRPIEKEARLSYKTGTLERETFWAYDASGRLTSETDNQGHALTTAYDSAGRASSVATAGPQWSGTKTISYQWDLAGNRTRLTWPDGFYVTYTYDALNRMTLAKENGSTTLAAYAYDTLSRRTSLAFAGGNSGVTYTYSNAGDLLTMAHNFSGTTNDVTFTQTYTLAHQLASKAVDKAAYEWSPGAVSTTAYASNGLNQYTSVAAASLAYDGAGNLTGDGVWTYAYDVENRLLTAVGPGVSASYLYDPRGRRVKKSGSGATTTAFLSDGSEEIAEYGAAGNLLRRYVPGPGTDMPVVQIEGATKKFFHADRQGSVVATSSQFGGRNEGPYTYDPYGNTSSATGVAFKYTGRRLDPETGLYYYRARYYSGALGRFLQTDPVGYADFMNLYAYVGNDPVNSSDPYGTETVTSCDGVEATCSVTPITGQTFAGDNALQDANLAIAPHNAALTAATGHEYGNVFERNADGSITVSVSVSDNKSNDVSRALNEIRGRTDNAAGDQHSHPTPPPGISYGGVSLSEGDVDTADIISTSLGQSFNRTIIDGPTGRIVSFDGRPGTMELLRDGSWQRRKDAPVSGTATVIGRIDPIPYKEP